MILTIQFQIGFSGQSEGIVYNSSKDEVIGKKITKVDQI